MSESKKVVVKVDAHDDKDKRKVMKAVSRLSGVESLAMDMKDKKLTVIGEVDPVCVARKLKCWHPVIVTVGPAKDEKKSDKKDEKKDDKKTKEEEAWEAYRACYPYMTQRYCVYSVEENPNACVIC